jgi:hypothetical protein
MAITKHSQGLDLGLNAPNQVKAPDLPQEPNTIYYETADYEILPQQTGRNCNARQTACMRTGHS